MPTVSDRRHRFALPALCLLLTLLLCLSAYLLTGARLPQRAVSAEATVPPAAPFTRVVIDAGHGGEDGGAQSASGLPEKQINLQVAQYLRAYLEAVGIPTVMTRTEDKLLYDPTTAYKGRKKQLDLAARLEIATAVPNSLFVSIHMNAYPDPRYSGMQVWYSPANPLSEQVAARIQTEALRLTPQNRRRIKAAGSNIFLLDRLDTPAVLVEGGFLSNPEEAARLGTEAYQRRLAFLLFTAITDEMYASQGE